MLLRDESSEEFWTGGRPAKSVPELQPDDFVKTVWDIALGFSMVIAMVGIVVWAIVRFHWEAAIF